MQSLPTIDFRLTDVAKQPERLERLRGLVADNGLGLDAGLPLFVKASSGLKL